MLPLVIGRATRLARFFSATQKSYLAEIVLGIATDTFDAEGEIVGGARAHDPAAPLPGRDAILQALRAFRGTVLQRPPRYSAKKVGGVAAHRLARRGVALAPLDPVEVRVERLELIDHREDRLRLALTVSSGFYVRALAEDVGARLGCGAHLVWLRRTAAGPFDEAQAHALGEIEADPAGLRERLVPMDALLPEWPLVQVGAAGLARVRDGAPVREHDVLRDTRPAGGTLPALVRVVDMEDHLVAIAKSAPDGGRWPLHPRIVLT